MATDDDKKTGGPPKKKKKKRPASAPLSGSASGPSTAPSEAAPKAKLEKTKLEKEPEEAEREESDALVVRGGESTSLDAPPRDDEALAAAREGEEGEGGDEDQTPAQLGTDRYVLAGFFAAGMVGAYILGRTLHGLWAYLANLDWFTQNLTRLAAVPDDDKATISMIFAGIVALVAVFRAYKRPDVRTWSDEVATELTKVKWPTRKDVTNSTLVVIAASTVATVYLALLDRLWAFVTNLVYGTGS